jgi:YidC/Oxa1 family membrane protein insertase
MDKRNFAFVALFSLALVGINIGFHYWNESQQQDYRKKLAEYQAYTSSQSKQSLKAQTFSLDHLPRSLPYKSSALGFAHPHFAVVFLDKNAPKSIDTLSLFAFEQTPENCAIYLDPKFETFIEACRCFSQDNADKKLVTLTINQEGTIQTYPALVHKNMTLSSPLSEAEGGFNPAAASGLLWVSYDNQPLPVGYSCFDGKNLVAIPFSSFAAVSKFKIQTPSALASQEQHFVLQNDYMQLVVSSKGGAISEINLPFESKDSASVVKEARLDRELMAQSPENCHFPIQPAQGVDATGKAYTLEPALGGYYPLLRRDLKTRAGMEKAPAAYNALSVVGPYPELSELHYKLIEQDAHHLVLEAKDPQRSIRRTYQLPKEAQKEPYVFETSIEVEGDRSNLWISTGVPEAEEGSSAPLPVMKYRLTKGRYSDIENFDVPKNIQLVEGVHPDWVCNGNAFFAIFLDPIRNQFPGVKLEKIEGEQILSRLTQIDGGKYSAESLPGYRMLLPLPAEKQKLHLRVMAGPLADSVLSQLDETYADPKTNYTPEYSSALSFTGWFSFVLRPFSSFMMLLMNLFHAVSGSWVLAIFLLTCVLRLMMYPLNAKSNRSMKAMQEVSPKVEALQKKYKDDPKKAQAEMVALYRQHGVNPLSGCLPILIQIPFLFSMLHLFKTNFSLRGASFIPGWIDDLSAPDILFEWGYSIPFIGSSLHLLPILLGFTMLAQGMLNSSQKTSVTDTQRQQQAMNNMMTLVFTFMFYHLPAGLNLYWLFSSVLGIAQQLWQSGRFSGKKTS